MPEWFLLDDGPADGFWNMACDEFLFRSAERFNFPILRLYSFEPPSITLGYHERADRILEFDRVRDAGIFVVRRPTGGRALFHKNEITYTVIGNDKDFDSASSLTRSFERISKALAISLSYIGINASIYRGGKNGGGAGDGLTSVPGSGTHLKSAPCIAAGARFELNVDGRKIAGSAQRRSEGSFLQHGSIFIERGSEEIVKFLKGRWDDLGRHMTTVSDEAGRGVSRGELRELLLRGFSEEFEIDFVPLELDEEQSMTIKQIVDRKRKEFESFFGG